MQEKKETRLGRFDSVSLGGIAVFGALAVILTTVSQGLGLNFPVVPYLQFDFGEVAILLSFFIFGPGPALVSALIEFVTLMVIGNEVAFFGPELKLIAILSSLLGIWLGAVLVGRMWKRRSIGKAVGLGTVLGVTLRAVIMTVPNYLLIVLLFGINGIMFVASGFGLIGITVTPANVLVLVLAMTAVFNVLQLLLVSTISFLLIRLPQLQAARAAGRTPWIVAYTRKLG